MCQLFVPEKIIFDKHLFKLCLWGFGIGLTNFGGKVRRRGWGEETIFETRVKTLDILSYFFDLVVATQAAWDARQIF